MANNYFGIMGNWANEYRDMLELAEELEEYLLNNPGIADPNRSTLTQIIASFEGHLGFVEHQHLVNLQGGGELWKNRCE